MNIDKGHIGYRSYAYLLRSISYAPLLDYDFIYSQYRFQLYEHRLRMHRATLVVATNKQSNQELTDLN